VLTDGLLALRRQVPPSGQQVLLNILSLLGSHLRQDGLALADNVLLLWSEPIPVLQICANLGLPLGSHFLERGIVLHEAFLLIRWHALQLLNPLWRHAGHLISGGIFVGAVPGIVGIRAGLDISVALILGRIVIPRRRRGWGFVFSALRSNRIGN